MVWSEKRYGVYRTSINFLTFDICQPFPNEIGLPEIQEALKYLGCRFEDKTSRSSTL